MSLFKKIRKTKIFKLFSSVKLAVPLLLTLAAIVAFGTTLEARYNADYAKLIIYQTNWFYCLLGVLWLNILCAALSRLPWKKQHTGFVITHLGMLTLIMGSFITSIWGIDGQLRIAEGTTDSTVFLSNLGIEISKETDPNTRVTPRVYPFERRTSHLGLDDLSFINDETSHIFTAKEYLPFTKMEEKFVEGDSDPTSAPNYAVGIWLKSNFFSVSEWLNTKDKAEVQMGPAKLRLIVDNAKMKAVVRSAIKSPVKQIETHTTAPVADKIPGSQEPTLVITDSGGQVLTQTTIAKLKAKPVTVKDVKISLVKIYEQAQVNANKLSEGGGKGLNPALELRLEQKGKVIREVSYAKFATFSLNQAPPFGLKFQYKHEGGASDAKEAAEETSEAPTMGSAAIASTATGDRMGNTIEFHINPANDQEVRVELYKKNQLVLTQTATSGKFVDTPWMGMRITLGSIIKNSSRETSVTAIPVVEKADLPPSAILIQPRDSKGSFWLVEGTAQKFQSRNETYEIYYGRRSLRLPFELKLEKFFKKDYPGTETPMSYESHVKVDGQGDTTVISMNEPLKRDGFTLYQASYQMNPGEPVASIFSVNRDPGRPFKYLGGIILAIGIITFTVMRTKSYKDFVAKRSVAT